MKNKTIIIIVLIFLAVFIVFGGISAFYSVRNFGNIENIDFKGPKNTIELDETRTLNLDGVNLIEIYGVASDIDISNGGIQLSARLTANYISRGGEIEFIGEKVGTTAVIRVKYPKSIFNLSDSRLTIQLPDTYQGKVTINSVSGDIDTVGTITNSLKALKVNSTSSDIYLEIGNIVDLSLHCISGNISIFSQISGDVNAESISGRIELEQIMDTSDVYVHTVSGNIDLTYQNPVVSDINSTSGSVSVRIIESDPINLDFDSTNGNMSGNVNIHTDGTSFKVSTVSGDLSFD